MKGGLEFDFLQLSQRKQREQINSAKEKGTANAISLSEVCAYIHRNGGLTPTNVEPIL